MKHFILTAFLVIGLLTAHNALAADEFGENFTGETPAGLAEGNYAPEKSQAIAMDEEAVRLQDIIPAAGDEEEEAPVEKPAKSEEDQPADKAE
tara:strand:- start:4578 stop:4856 length:279 start_codon:yes stop_codon:yes gene_type:complete